MPEDTGRAQAKRTGPSVCHLCARKISTGYDLLGGPICNPCYSKLRRNAASCPSCGLIKVLAFHDKAKTIVCAHCAGVPPRFACNTCGSEDQLTGSQCGTCRLKDRAGILLSRSDGTLHPGLAGLYDHLLTTPDKRSVTRWLRHERIHTTLRAMALGDVPVSHATLNQLPQTHRTRYLRRLLISARTLPAIDVNVNAYEVFAETFLETLAPAHAAVVRRYHRWYVLRVLRQQAMIEPIRPSANYRRRRELKAIRDFLVWLDTQGLTLASARQAHLDHYLVHAVKTGEELATFIGWSNKTRLTRQLEPPARKTPQPQASISEEQRWSNIDRLVTDESIQMNARLIGLFILLFAQPLTTCVRLKRSNVLLKDKSVFITFATDPIELPGPVACLTRRYMDDPNSRAIYRAPDSDWLFEGLMPTTHVTAEYLRTLLLHAGINPNQAKSAALRQLTTALPARIVADTIGISVDTASRWAQQSGGTWKDYPGIR